MLIKLIEKLKQEKLDKALNKPRYKLGKLYIGEIVFYKYRENIGNDKFNHVYTPVKKFAILTEIGYEQYLHIKSNQEIYLKGSMFSVIGSHVVTNVRKFVTASPGFMHKMNYTPSTKVSKAFIEEYENKMNKLLSPEQEVDELFK